MWFWFWERQKIDLREDVIIGTPSVLKYIHVSFTKTFLLIIIVNEVIR